MSLFASEEDSGIRQSVAENPKAPLISLIGLAKDVEHQVREAVAFNPEKITPPASDAQ